MSDPGGWLWVVIGLLGVGGLALAIAYATGLWRRRPKSPEIESIKDEATRNVYREEEKEGKKRQR